MGGDLGDAVDQVVWGDVVLAVVGAEALRGDAGVLHLVVAAGVETDGVGARGLAEHLAQHAGDGGTVGAAGEEAAHAGAVDLAPHAVFDDLQEAGFGLVEAGAAVLVELRVPPAAQLGLAVLPLDEVAVGQAHDAVENGRRCRDHVEEEVLEHRLRGELALDAGHGVGAVGEVQPAIALGVADRPGAEAVGGEQRLAPVVGHHHHAEAPGSLVHRVVAETRKCLCPGRCRALAGAGLLQCLVAKARPPEREAHPAAFLVGGDVGRIGQRAGGELQAREPAGQAGCRIRRTENTTESFAHVSSRGRHTGPYSLRRPR